MNEDRLTEIEKLAQIGASGGYDVIDLVAEVRRLRDGCTGIADELLDGMEDWHYAPALAEMVEQRLRALLGEGND